MNRYKIYINGGQWDGEGGGCYIYFELMVKAAEMTKFWFKFKNLKN